MNAMNLHNNMVWFIINHIYIYIYIVLVTIYECNLFYVYILSLVFLSLHLYMYCLLLYPKNLIYRGFMEYVVNARDFWFSMKGAPSEIFG